MQKRIHFKGPFKNSISFDKNEIRKRIVVPTFRDARRCANIYNALIQEFYEGGCPTSAKYFKILLDTECTLYKNASIRDRISDEPKLLLSLFDNCKIAEMAVLSRHCNGPATCSRLLLQCILMFENYTKYNWILLDVFRIIIEVTNKVCQSKEVSKEHLCRIYFKFGTYLMKCDLEEATRYLEKSFDMARGTTWMYTEFTNDNKPLYLASVIADAYASALLIHANDIFSTTPERAINYTQKAVVILMAVGVENNDTLYIRANLYMADFQLKFENYRKSLLILENIIEYISPRVPAKSEYSKFLSRYSHLKGLCFKCLKKYDVSLVELYKSLEIARHLNMKQEEGIILLDIAKVYINCGHVQFPMAGCYLRQSKEIFVALNDMFNAKKTSYLMANLKVHNIRPLMLDLIKFSSVNYCNKYRLMRWKGSLQPFWSNLQSYLLHEEPVSLECDLKATEILK